MRKITNMAASVLLAAALFSCNSSSTKEEENKQTDTSKTVTDKTVPADTSKKALQVTAMFVDFTLGDASHYSFKDEADKEWDFARNEDTTFRFAIELPKGKANTSNQGWGSDKALQGKWFNITYVYRNEPLYEGGPVDKVAVITEVKLK